ncbi:MAG: acetate/propionate family kinase [Candidatus Nitrosoglobus sp.]
MKILVINSGSSSIKYRLFQNLSQLADGIIERIGESRGRFVHRLFHNQGIKEVTSDRLISDHEEGMDLVFTRLIEAGCLRHRADLLGIGHRVVHGGEIFKEPTLIDEKALININETIPLAPLHNPANLKGIEIALKICPDVPQVAVFDTAFHQTLPARAFHYPVPYSWYKTYHVRRYGFHGTSYYSISKQAAAYLKKPVEKLNLIALHLGNGASATAIKAGRSIDTSMGMTPLEGLMMGTRCGDIDPSLPFYLVKAMGKSNEELDSLLTRESGLKGICGANDMREVHALAKKGNPMADLAIEMYCYRIKKYIGAYYAVLGHLDALIFSGGIGENDALIRENVCTGLANLGITIDNEKNQALDHQPFAIQRENGLVKVLVIPTNEELEIAQQTLALIQNRI